MRREPDPSENNSTGRAQTIGLVFATQDDPHRARTQRSGARARARA